MKKKIILIVLLLCLPVFTAMAGEKIGPMPTDLIGKAAWIKAVIGDVIGKVSDPARHFYGVVVDQHGAPVAGAELVAQWRYISLDLRDKVKEITLTTDAAGRFDFSFGFFGQPYVGEMRKKGYEYIYSWNPYDTAVNNQMDLIAQSSTTPIVFILRKMNPTTYLYSWGNNRIQMGTPTYVGAYDIFSPSTKPIDPDLTKLRNPDWYDLVFDVSRVGAGYQVHILPVRQGSFQFNDQLLYEAPANGYLPEVTLPVAPNERRTTYLYFTSRNPAVYSRMEIEVNASAEMLFLSFKTWTNPYGSRNLENEPDLPADLLIKLLDEAEAALTSGKLPPEPNIPQMIASGLYR